MAKIERNAPCPCGSGRKYKKCCLAKDEAPSIEALRLRRANEEEAARERTLFQARFRAANRSLSEEERSRASRALLSEPGAQWLMFDDGLDDLSNSVLDLIRERKFDEALDVCRRLLDEFPEVIDGIDRYAKVYAAMGEFTLARDYYRRALEFTELPEQRDGFDEEGREWRREKIADLDATIAALPPGHDAEALRAREGDATEDERAP